MPARKTFEEIREIYLKRYPHLVHLSDPHYFARAAIILAAPETITPQDTVVLARATQWRATQDEDTAESLIEWGKENGY